MTSEFPRVSWQIAVYDFLHVSQYPHLVVMSLVTLRAGLICILLQRFLWHDFSVLVWALALVLAL